MDISAEQQREFLVTLWAIMVQFVDMGFGIDATQLVLAAHSIPDTSPALTAEFEQFGCPNNETKEESGRQA